MAKRKRLEVPKDTTLPELETKSAIPPVRTRMPIAEVAGDTAGRAALEEVAREMTTAEAEGRVVKKLALDKIALHHLVRDRMVLDEEEMSALIASIEARGQQTPVEVVRLSGGEFGLISGLRRVEALRRIGRTEVLAIIRQPESSRTAYQAMVEENEIRADLSFFERAQIAVASVGQGVYPDPRSAVKGLFAHAPKAKRSKILKFVTVSNALGKTLRFPTAIPEHLGVRLGQAIETDANVGGQVGAALRAADPQDAAAERAVLEAALKPPATRPASEWIEVGQGLRLEGRAGRAVLSGKAVDAAFLETLQDWLRSRS
ncbi:MAG: ParB N-terminal domain-containing protein [Pseudomonadota bacterium]